MKNQQNKSSSFWFGFALGLTAATSASYLLGTKNGRENLKKIIEFSEKLPEHFAELSNHSQTEKGHKNNLNKLETIESVVKKIKNSYLEKIIKK